MTIQIRQHTPGKDVKDFMKVPFLILGDDPNWIPPLNIMMSDTLSPKHNPFFLHAEVALFTAWKDRKLVGRASAQVDREHLKRHGDQTGFFGFFDTIDDEAVGQALIDAAANWLRTRGMRRMRGPMSFSVNEELGTLVEGFNTPNVLYMAHHKPHQDRIAKAAGLEKAKDLFAFQWEMGALPKRAYRAHAQIKEYPEVRLRPVDFKNDIDQLMAIQDDAWKDNWSHVSMTEAEGKQLAKDLALLLDPRITVVAEIDGELAGMALPAPNLNEAIRDFNGKLSPTKVAKLLYRLKVRQLKSARLIMLGIKERFRKQKRYGSLALAMCTDIAERGRTAGYEWGELSWTLEDNQPVNLLIRSAGGKHYKTYRIYEKAL